MEQEKTTGLYHVYKATIWSLQGLKAAWGEQAFRMEVGLATVMIPAAFWLGTTLLETLFLIAVCALVLICELANSAIEAVVDRVGTEYHELSGRAKDMGSAMVFISLNLAGFTWLAMLWQRFLS